MDKRSATQQKKKKGMCIDVLLVRILIATDGNRYLLHCACLLLSRLFFFNNKKKSKGGGGGGEEEEVCLWFVDSKVQLGGKSPGPPPNNKQAKHSATATTQKTNTKLLSH